MASDQSPSDHTPKTSAAFEYFLYAAILAETALAALIYKVLFRSDELAHLRIYFAIFYFGFLGWGIAQLNRLHRNRKSLGANPAPLVQHDSEQMAEERAHPLLGLTGSQVVTVVLVFATAVAAFTWLLRSIG